MAFLIIQGSETDSGGPGSHLPGAPGTSLVREAGLLAELDRLKPREKTVVVFWSDQGDGPSRVSRRGRPKIPTCPGWA